RRSTTSFPPTSGSWVTASPTFTWRRRCLLAATGSSSAGTGRMPASACRSRPAAMHTLPARSKCSPDATFLGRLQVVEGGASDGPNRACRRGAVFDVRGQNSDDERGAGAVDDARVVDDRVQVTGLVRHGHACRQAG